MTIKVENIEVEVLLKKIKNMHLYVKPADGRVSVSAPMDTKEESVALFVRKNFGWVMRQRRAIQSQPRESPREYVDGETYYLWGEQYFLKVESKGVKRWGGIRFSGNEMILIAPEASSVKTRGEYVEEWYRRILVVEIRERLPRWERVTGFSTDRFTVQKMTRSWGICAKERGLVRFNLQLAKKPKEALDYVIVHELCHFKYRTHGPRFQALLDRFMPNWRDVRQKLNLSLLGG